MFRRRFPTKYNGSSYTLSITPTSLFPLRSDLLPGVRPFYDERTRFHRAILVWPRRVLDRLAPPQLRCDGALLLPTVCAGARHGSRLELGGGRGPALYRECVERAGSVHQRRYEHTCACESRHLSPPARGSPRRPSARGCGTSSAPCTHSTRTRTSVASRMALANLSLPRRLPTR